MSWNEAFLKDLADIQLGKMLDKKKNQGEYRPYLGNDNVQWGFVDTSQIKEMKFKSSELERFSLRHGDILVCEGGDPGRCALWLSDTPMCYQKALHRVRVYDRLDSRYLFHYLTYLGFTQEIRQYYTGGATIKHLPKAALSRVVIRYPEISIQKRIASILFAYDELIENNRKEIKLLEEAAQRLYKEWFIDLKFPGHESTPINPETNLPEGWKKGTVSELFQIVNGFAFKSETFVERGSYSIVTIKNVKDGQFDSLGMATIDELPERMPCDCILHRGDILLSLTGNVGRTCIITAKDCLLNQRVGKVVSNYPTYSYCFLRNSRQQSRMVTLANGTAQLNLSPVRFCEDFTIVPSGYLLEEFEQVTHLLITEIIFLSEQVTHLQEARDRLLPKLMSGEIEVN